MQVLRKQLTQNVETLERLAAQKGAKKGPGKARKGQNRHRKGRAEERKARRMIIRAEATTQGEGILLLRSRLKKKNFVVVNVSSS